MSDFGFYIALWGACLSTFLAAVKGLELWRDRFQIDVDYKFTTNDNYGNNILIRNLSMRPLILSYWELSYGSGRWPLRKFESIECSEHDAGDRRIEPHTTHTLNFSEQRHFAWGHKALRGRKIYIRLHVAGRKAILRQVYPD